MARDEERGKAEKGKKHPKISFKVVWIRRGVQLTSLLLFSGLIFNLEAQPALLPILLGLGSPNRIVGDAFEALQIMLSWVVLPFIPIASILLFGVVFGRLLCGWVCPFGFVQDLLGYVKRKHKVLSLRTHERFKKFKYGILGVTLLISGSLAVSLFFGFGQPYKEALGVFATAPFSAISPATTLFSLIPTTAFRIQLAITTMPQTPPEEVLNIITEISPIFYIRLILLGFILVGAIFIPRFWCRYFCPVGAFSSLFSRFSFLGMKRDLVKCTKCPHCVEKCPMMIRILDLPWEKFTDLECIMCLECRDACPRKALSPKIP